MGGKLVVWQPVYFPNLHYLARLNSADGFVVFDNAEFSRQSRQHRAPIDHGGKTWLTIPIRHGSERAEIRNTEIDMTKTWPRKHLMTIRAKYGGDAPNPFETAYEGLGDEARLTDVTLPLLRTVIEAFHIDIKMMLASALGVPYEPGQPSEFLANVTDELGYDTYYCGRRAYENYLREEPFEERGIEIEIQNWETKWPDGNTICLDVLYGAERPATYIQ